MVSNATMLSPPGHRLLATLPELIAETGMRANDHRDVLVSTGPAMLGAAVDGYAGHEVTILDPVSFCPFATSEAGREAFEQRRREVGDDGLRSEGVMAIHRFSNSWVSTLADELVNPKPFDIPGFVFFSRYDSAGADLTNRGRVIERVAMECAALDACAFNTDSFLKLHVSAPSHWARRDDWGEEEGLYLSQPIYEELLGHLPELANYR